MHSSSLSGVISALAFALLASVLTSLYQERLYWLFGKHPDEAMFDLHLLSLPLFARIGTNIYHHVQLLNQSFLSPFEIDDDTNQCDQYGSRRVNCQYPHTKNVYPSNIRSFKHDAQLDYYGVRLET